LKKALLLTGTTFLMMVLLHSCAAIKYTLPPDPVSLKDTVTALNGDYKNLLPDSSKYAKYETLWSILTNRIRKNPDTTHYPLSFVRLSVKNKRRVEATLYVDSVAFSKTTLKGKVKKGGYFSVRRKVLCIPLIPVLYFYSEYKILIGKDSSNQLFIHCMDEGASYSF
jgi:hypothetical protein